jgi:predicted acylesterase/phospholipase RssA
MRGGGVRGIAFAGALAELQCLFEPTAYIGTSAGAGAAILLAAGYTPRELESVLWDSDFGTFKDASPLQVLRNLFLRGHMYPGKTIVTWLESLLRRKIVREGEVQLAHLPVRTVLFAVEPRFGSIIFDSNGEHRGIEAAMAARHSMSIPIFFEPLVRSMRPVYDGGVIKNFPLLTAVHDLGFPRDHVIGLYLTEPAIQHEYTTKGVVRDLLRIWLNQDESQVVDRYRNRIVAIDTSPVRATQFEISDEAKELLVLRGRLAAVEFVTSNFGDIAEVHEVNRTQAMMRVKELERSLASKADKRRYRRWVISAVTACLFAAGLVYLNAWRNDLWANTAICINQREYVRIPKQEVELAIGGRRQKVVVGDFYAQARTSDQSEQGVCSTIVGSASRPDALQRISAEVCRSQGGRLPTESEWLALQKQSERDSTWFAKLRGMSTIGFSTTHGEWTADCYGSPIIEASSATNPKAVRPGCGEHVSRRPAPDGQGRANNHLGSTFRCVLDSGLDQDGRILRWLVAGTVPWKGCDSRGHMDVPQIATLSPKPRSGERVPLEQWERQRWREYRARVVDGQSVSPCGSSPTNCNGNSIQSMDLACHVSLHGSAASASAVMVATYIVASEDQAVDLVVAGDDNYIFWYDGHEVARYEGPCDCLSEERTANQKRVTLKKGVHLMVGVVSNQQGWWGVSVKLRTPAGSKPQNIGASANPDDGDLVLSHAEIHVPREGQERLK